MKNIHILPTNKPTGIFESKNGLHFSIIEKIRYGEFKGFHIYITSDEEIKDGDWHLNIVTNKISKYNIGLLNPNRSNYKKIILTTDPDLIKDGVQEIDEEYLEWFVKNPSCDYVEIEDSVWDGISKWIPYYDIIIPEEPNPCKDIVINDKATIDVPFHNKPIRFENLTSEQAGYLLQVSEFYQLSGTRRSAVVPQEEPKQIKCYCGHTITCDCEPLQETFEEAAERESQLGEYDRSFESTRKNYFIKGAKWQQERMYIDIEVFTEELKDKIDSFEYSVNQNSYISDYIKEWFEQYKKK
jgi:hypothetical protein